MDPTTSQGFPTKLISYDITLSAEILSWRSHKAKKSCPRNLMDKVLGFEPSNASSNLAGGTKRREINIFCTFYKLVLSIPLHNGGRSRFEVNALDT